MTTLISKTEHGKTRTCDARCYTADGEDCTCICGGRNHGKGLNAAVRQTADLAAALERESGELVEFAEAVQLEIDELLQEADLAAAADAQAAAEAEAHHRWLRGRVPV